MARASDWFVGIIVFLFFIFIALIGVGLFVCSGSGSDDGLFSGRASVAVVEVKGAIFDAEKYVADLKKWHRRDYVKAIVIRLDSPGGGVAASHEVYDQVKNIVADGTPVVMSMGTVAASGAYYIACAGTKVFSNPGTMTGSIGVVMDIPVAAELLDKVGIGFETIISGKFKDSGNPAREMRPEERRYFQELVDDNHREFIRIVAEGRDLPVDDVEKVADGRVFTGMQALKLGLVDTLGTYQDAIAYAKEIAGLDSDASVVKTKPEKLTLWNLVMSDLNGLFPETAYGIVPQYIVRRFR